MANSVDPDEIANFTETSKAVCALFGRNGAQVGWKRVCQIYASGSFWLVAKATKKVP